MMDKYVMKLENGMPLDMMNDTDKLSYYSFLKRSEDVNRDIYFDNPNHFTTMT